MATENEADFDGEVRAINEVWPGRGSIGVSKIAGMNKAMVGIVDQTNVDPSMRQAAVILDKVGMLALLEHVTDALALMNGDER